MIYLLARFVQESLSDLKFPVRVIYGPEDLNTSDFSTRIVIERDRSSGDAFDPSRGVKENPKRLAVRQVGAQATIYARSNLAGARDADHEDLCDQIVDAFYCALREVFVLRIHMPAVPVTEARYLAPSELPGVGTIGAPGPWPGVAYRMRWRTPRSVERKTYSGEGLPIGVIGGTSGEVRIQRDTPAEGDTPDVVELP